MTSVEFSLYVRLLGEGTEAYRITKGIRIDDSTFEILGPRKLYDPSDEQWEFPPGSIVKCKETMREGKAVYIAYEELKRPSSNEVG